MRNEEVLLRERDVTVTPSRLIVGNRTYSVRNVTAFEMTTTSRASCLSVFVFALGPCVAAVGVPWAFADSVIGFGVMFAGVTLMTIGCILMGRRFRRRTHHLHLDTASGKSAVYSTGDAGLAVALQRAMDHAITMRD